jgi:hypothetical protein
LATVIDPKIAKTQTRALSDAFSRANSPANPLRLFLHVDRNFSPRLSVSLAQSEPGIGGMKSEFVE